MHSRKARAQKSDGSQGKSEVRNDLSNLATDPSAPYPFFTHLGLGCSLRMRLGSSCCLQPPHSCVQNRTRPVGADPALKVGDTGDQPPAPASITRAPCALRVKVRFTLMPRHPARKSHNPGSELCAFSVARQVVFRPQVGMRRYAAKFSRP